jgi:hypothetical protein
LQRVTTLSKGLESTDALTNWACRMTLIGAASRADIIASAQATDPEDRKALDALVDKAKELGGANVRRELGTALHKFFELKAADPTYVVPEPYAADVDAILAAIDAAGFDIVTEHSERLVVIYAVGCAGTPDLILRRRSDGAYFIADLKTGSSVKYGVLGFSVQLTTYSLADAFYVHGADDQGRDDLLLPMPKVSQELGIIIHCQPGSGTADLHWLTLDPALVDLAVAVREVRKRRDLLVLHQIEGGGENATTGQGTASTAQQDVVGTVDDPTTATALDILHEARTAWLINRTTATVKALSKRHVAEVWPTDIARPADIKAGERWSPDDIDTITKALDALEAKHDVPFGDEDPKVTDERRRSTEVKLLAERQRMADIDRFQMVKSTPKPSTEVAPQAAVEVLLGVIQDMAHGTPDERERIGRVQLWQKQGSDRGVPWKIGQYTNDKVPLRLYAVVAAAVGCAELIDPGAADPDGPVRDLLSVALEDHDLAQQPSHPVGALIGLLTTEQALRLAELAEGATS